MNSTWQAFLAAAGAEIEAGRVTGFGDAAGELAAADGCILADLSHYAVVRAAGEEAREFLHNQFTNDVKQQADDHSRLNNYCTPKGRILASLRVFVREGEPHLRLSGDLVEPFTRRLGMFILRSKVTLTNLSDTLVRFGLAGPGAEAALAAQLGTLPSEADAVVQADAITVIRLPGAERFELHGPDHALEPLWQALTTTARPVGERVWALGEIRHGLPLVTAATLEAFVPQMLNMQLIGGLSFKKGCYPGQEIVARMQYLGQLKRRMYLAHVDAETAPLAGDSLFAPGSSSGQGAGKVVDSAAAPGGGYDLLCVAEISSAEADDLHLQADDGPKLTLRELPYPFA